MEGKKNDTGKIRWSLVPWEVMTSVCRILEFGAKKYSEDNWKKVPGARERYKDAIARHLFGDGDKSVGYMNGEIYDLESKENHLAHVIASALFLMWFDQNPEKEPK